MDREDRKAIERKHKMILDVVKSVIDEWDPYDLTNGGAPTDEFEGEIQSIASQIANIKSSDDATHLISIVFSDSFDQHDFKNESYCHVGAELYSALRTHNLLK